MKRASGWAVVMTVVAAMSGVRIAHGDAPAWSIVDIAPGEATRLEPSPPPRLRIKVVGEGAPTGEDVARWTLRQVDGRLRPVSATRVIPYHRSTETLAVVVLIEGHEYYFGNDTYVEDATPEGAGGEEGAEAAPVVRKVIGKRRAPGVHAAIRDALDVACDPAAELPAALACAGPPGSKGAIVVYGSGAQVRAPLAELTGLGGAQLGPQQLQQNQAGRDLSVGLQVAAAQLEQAVATRKILIIISDGVESGGADALRAVKQKLDHDNVRVFALQLEAESKYIPDDRDTKLRGTEHMKLLGERGAHVRVRTARELAAKLSSIASDALNDRFWLEFPGQVVDARTRQRRGVELDGKPHELSLLLDEEPVGATQLATLGTLAPGRTRWWPWVALGAALLFALIVLGRRGRKPTAIALAPAPVPVATRDPVHRPMKPVPEPAVGHRTVAINIDGIPLVGWLVPINGPHQFQTFKLGSGVTKIGNAREAHIFFDDRYMSGEHVHIAMTPDGFTLVDNLSSNGTYVNERRVDRHELLDNDVIKLGKTDVKFKTNMS